MSLGYTMKRVLVIVFLGCAFGKAMAGGDGWQIPADSLTQIQFMDEAGNKQVLYTEEAVYKTKKDPALDVDPSNLFLVSIYTLSEPISKGIVLQTSKQKSVEEILMYDVLKSYWQDKKWVRFVEGSTNSEPFQVGHPSSTADGKRIFFISDMPGGIGGTDIYYADFIGGKWSEPKNLGPAINTKGNETFPVIEENNRLRYISNGGLTYIKITQILGPVGAVDKTITEPIPTVSNVTNQSSQNTANVAPPANVNANADNVYRITLGGFKTPQWDVLNQFKEYGELITEVNAEGITLVRLGDFTDLAKAKQVVAEVRKRKWFENASLYLYKGGKYIKQ
ncbi:MAG: hypothetical protein K1X55_05215 [Chitinophagales bacterium]|nr:hypothetical protein [Chitinophagales bacterium]